MSPTIDAIARAIDLSPEPTALVDRDGVLRHANPALRAAFGGDPAGLLDQEVCAALTTNPEDAVVDQVALPEPAGWRVCVLRRVEHARGLLQERSAILSALIDAAPVAIMSLDLDKRVTMWNPAAERIFGWTRDEILGEPYPLVPPEEAERFEEFFRTVIGGTGFTGVEAVREGRDGRRCHVAISTAPIRDQQGTVTGAMAILEDITERKHLEERFLHAQKMEAVGRLAGGIAHDFNNVLTVILAYCDALLMARDPARMLKDISAIQRSAERAADLTRQLLAFGRRQVLRTRLVDLNEAIRGTSEVLRRLIGEDIGVRLDLQPDLPPVRVDPTQLEQLLMNLAANARDAMPDGGDLQIATRLAGVRELPREDPWVVLTIRDTGEGMDASTLDHLFEPFFTTKELGRGTGLGLATVYGIVRQSGGEVAVRSAPGEGTEFRIYLPPAAGQVHAPLPSVPPDPTAGCGRRVLVVEDDEDLRNVVEQTLRAHGYAVRTAGSGREALDLVQRAIQPFDLVLTDVVMAGMNGRALAAALRERCPTLRVVFMSGYTDDEVIRRGVERGAAFLHKPFTAAALLQAIRGALDN